MTRPDASAPIGVFDSGLGGLTVVRRLRERLPHESILFVADQAHVPYGGRDLSEVCSFACAISESLLAQGCKAIVMACNISSATALRCVHNEYPEKIVLGVIAPGAQAAVAQTQTGRVGVLATEGTVRSGAYSRALLGLNPALRVTEIACPAFVPLVEAGEVDTPQAFAAARDRLAPLLAAPVDTVILGCTHYPFLLPTLEALAPALRFIDPALQTTTELADRLAASRLLAPASSSTLRLVTTGDLSAFRAQTRRFLPNDAPTAEHRHASWRSDILSLSNL